MRAGTTFTSLISSSGHRTLIHRNTEELSSYILDRDLGLRLATSTRGKGDGGAILRWTGQSFEEIRSIEADDVMGTHPSHINLAGSAWYLLSSIGRDKSALFRVDWETDVETLVASHDRADISGGFIDRRSGEFSAVSVEYVRREWIPIDPGTAQDIAHLERELNGVISIESQSDDNEYWVVAVTAPDQPASWHLYCRSQRMTTRLFSSRPKLEAVRLAPTRGVVITSRDGLELVSYLTLPANEDGPGPASPVPLVLFVHGGPWWRDSWAYNRQTQWYANRGYGVLQVNYRGSTGFGKAFVNAGDKEWAGKMHDDLHRCGRVGNRRRHRGTNADCHMRRFLRRLSHRSSVQPFTA